MSPFELSYSKLINSRGNMHKNNCVCVYVQNFPGERRPKWLKARERERERKKSTPKQKAQLHMLERINMKKKKRQMREKKIEKTERSRYDLWHNRNGACEMHSEQNDVKEEDKI